MPGLMWPECVGGSRVTKGIDATDWLSCSSDLNPIAAIGRYVSSTATDCPEAHWCPDPGLGADPPGPHPPTHQEHTWRCGDWIQARGGQQHYWVAVLKFLQAGSACDLKVLLLVWFGIQPTVGWWFRFPLTVVTSFCTWQITCSTSVKTFILSNLFIKIWSDL